MIISFKDKDTEALYEGKLVKRFESFEKIALRKLLMLKNAATFDDLKIPPRNFLKKLTGARAGQYSIRINDQYRVCFRWEDNNAHDVEITDYH